MFGVDPSPSRLDLNTLLVRDEDETFLITAHGGGMESAGIADGDIIVAEHHPYAGSGCVVVASVDGEPAVLRLSREGGKVLLRPEDPRMAPIDVSQHGEAALLGIARYSVRRFRP